MFYKSYTKSEARAFDHLYDPIYTTGDYQRDVQRENAIALTNTAPVNIYTNFDSMFSELSKRPRTHSVLQRNQLPTVPPEANGNSLALKKKMMIFLLNEKKKKIKNEIIPRHLHDFVLVSTPTVSHSTNGNHGDDASGQNRVKFFAIPYRKSRADDTKTTNSQFIEASDEKMRPNARAATSTTKPQSIKSRSISCQTIYREQSAQTKPYLPQIQYQPGIEKSQLFQYNAASDIDAPFGLSEIIAINRRRRRLECEKLVKQSTDLGVQKQQILETLEWQEWLTHENDIETIQSLRFRTVQEKLKRRNKLFERDSIKTIDLSIHRLNNEQKRQTETIT